MKWFFKPKYDLKKNISQLNDSSANRWFSCKDCNKTVYYSDYVNMHYVCPLCGYHYRISALDRIKLISDKDSFKEDNYANECYSDPIEFVYSDKTYKDVLSNTKEKTSLNDAVITGIAKISDIDVQICVMDFAFFGGSMGVIVGEKIVKAIYNALSFGLPLIIFSCSGGARMQEGVFSLMQMARTCMALSKFDKANLPYISILTDPTMGGVSASFSFLGDIVMSEPNSLVGFAGPRVIKGTLKQKLPKGFQKPQFLLDHGFIDFIVERKDLKSLIAKLLTYLS